MLYQMASLRDDCDPSTKSVQQARRQKQLVGKDRLDSGEQVQTQPRFHNIGRATSAHGGIYKVRVFVHCEKYDLGTAPGISQVARDIDPAHLSHGNIEDDHVGSELEVLAHDNSAVGYGADDLVALLFVEHLANMVENGRIIVAEKYGALHAGPLFELTRQNLDAVVRGDAIRPRHSWLLSELTDGRALVCPQLFGSKRDSVLPREVLDPMTVQNIVGEP
jgi:hypothetical protein